MKTVISEIFQMFFIVIKITAGIGLTKLELTFLICFWHLLKLHELILNFVPCSTTTKVMHCFFYL